MLTPNLQSRLAHLIGGQAEQKETKLQLLQLLARIVLFNFLSHFLAQLCCAHCDPWLGKAGTLRPQEERAAGACQPSQGSSCLVMLHLLQLSFPVNAHAWLPPQPLPESP